MRPPFASSIPEWPHVTRRRLVAALCLGALGAASNCIALPVLSGLTFALGGVFSLYATFTLGPVLAGVTAVAAFAPTVWLWQQPFALLFGTLEAIVCGLLYFRAGYGPARALVTFWLLIGLPLLALLALVWIPLPEPFCWELLVKYPTNSVLALLTAKILLRIHVIRAITGSPVREATTSLSQVLSRHYVPLVVLPTVFFAVLAVKLREQRVRDAGVARMMEAQRNAVNTLGAFLREHEHGIVTAAEVMSQVRGGTPDDLERILAAHRRVFPGFISLLVADAAGNVQAAVLPDGSGTGSEARLHGLNISDRWYFRTAMAQRGPCVSDAFRGRGFGDDLIVAIAAPILDQSGHATGVVEGSIRLRDLGVVLWNSHAPDARFVVLDRGRHVVTASHNLRLTPLQAYALHPELKAPHDKGVPVEYAVPRPDGGRQQLVLGEAASVPVYGWTILIEEPLWSFQQSPARDFAVGVAWALIAGSLALLLTRAISRQITQPFEALARSTELLLTDPTAAKPPAVAGLPTELAAISIGLHDAARRLADANGDLRRAVAERNTANASLRALSENLERLVRERTADLAAARDRAEQASRVKSDFVANMSHELRTPLNVILGTLQLFATGRYGALTDRQRLAVRRVASNGEYLLSLIEDVLDLAKIESGTFELNSTLVDAHELAAECVEMLSPEARRKGIAIEFSDTLEEVQFVGEKRRIMQVLVNLLANAVKFTPESGRVGIELGASERDVIFTVWDTGPGIAGEDQAALFAPFVRVAAAKGNNEPGFGLGLALVRRFVELHGGTVKLVSAAGRGCRFVVTLPRAIAPKPARTMAPIAPDLPAAVPKAPEPETGGRPTVLIAEDHGPNAEILSDFLEMEGFTPVVAPNGLAAVEAAINRRPAVILMDTQMPVLDGLEATRRLKADARTAAIPVIALTAFAQAPDRERCLAAGASAYIAKPVDFARLLELIRSVVPT